MANFPNLALFLCLVGYVSRLIFFIIDSLYTRIASNSYLLGCVPVVRFICGWYLPNWFLYEAVFSFGSVLLKLRGI